MVARILSGASIRGLLNYNENKVSAGTAKLVLANRFGLDIEQLNFKQKVKRFEHLTSLNARTKINALHIMLNFHRKDDLSNEVLQKITSEYMENIGFDGQPFLAYRHKDTAHTHIHIVTTNICGDGSRIDFHNIGKTLSETARKMIDLKYGLVMAEGREIKQKDHEKPNGIKPASYGSRETKKPIYNVVSNVLRSYSFTSLPEYNAALSCFNVTADRGKEGTRMHDRRGLVYSVIDVQGKRIGTPIKSSELPARPTLNTVERKFGRNIQKRKAHRESTVGAIDKAFGKPTVINKKTLVAELAKNNITIFFRQNGEGRTDGVTFVDQNTRSVFNGSDLGKAYGAKALLERLEKTGSKEEAKSLPIPSAFQSVGFEKSELGTRASAQRSKVGPIATLIERQDSEPFVNVQPRRKKKKKKNLSVDGMKL